MTDYYAVLGVAPNASAKEIKAKYRKLAKDNHPDLHPGDGVAEARFKQINEAWETLGDQSKRAQYDAERAKISQPKPKPKQSGGAPVGKVDFDAVMSQFDTFFGKAAPAQPGKAQPKNPLDASELFDKYMGFKKR